MKNLVANFSKQMQEAIKIGENAKITPAKAPLQNVVITGLGGSGIGGSLISEIVSKTATIPILVNKDYFLPGFVNENSLVIVSTYSGNTEETLSCFEQAIARKAKIVVITSGGKALEMAKQNGADWVVIPGGNPPRSCLGYSSIQLFYILHKLQIIPAGFAEELQKSIALLDTEEENIKELAGTIAKQLIDKMPVIYSDASMEAVAIRFRQQINENAKMLCWHHVLPEMNHNELVGWTEKHQDIFVIFIRNTSDFFRTQKRMEICKEILQQYTPHSIDIWSKGDSAIENAYYHIHLGDWISVLIAEIKNIDVSEIKVIDFLKNALSKI
jgi:glucose/mannose-6-phosphate isomerase